MIDQSFGSVSYIFSLFQLKVFLSAATVSQAKVTRPFSSSPFSDLRVDSQNISTPLRAGLTMQFDWDVKICYGIHN